MKIKNGVMIFGLHPEMQRANCIASVLYSKYGKELVLTSGVEYRGGNGSLHEKGRACDYRIRFFEDQTTKESVACELTELLGNDFDVILEADHIHCEYDPDDAKII